MRPGRRFAAVGRELEQLVRDAELIEAIGPWPFVTRKTLSRPDGSRVVVHSRHHRKGLLGVEAAAVLTSGERWLRCLWMPRQLNWWIGTIFAIGSFLFALGAVLSLLPGLAREWQLDPMAVNAIFFTGSIPFTTAGYLQLYQSANAPSFDALGKSGLGTERRRWLGWRPREIGWLSCALQFAGTVLFNFNTFDAMLPGLNWLRQDWLIWVPDVAGSVLFLASGYLAFIETCHSHWAWRPRELSWWLTFVNLLGCVAFMISAVFAYVPESSPGFPTMAVAFTLLGAVGFFAGSVLMLPETAMAVSTRAPRSRS